MVGLLASIYLAFALGNIRSSSATTDELVHLWSGWTALRWDDFRLNPEHPPLAKMTAALAIRSWLPGTPPQHANLVHPHAVTSWQRLRATWAAAAEGGAAQWYFAHYASFPLSDSFLDSINAADPAAVPTDIDIPSLAWLWDMKPELTRARLAMLLWPLLLFALLARWGRALAGALAALAAAAFLATDPSFLAHGGLVTTDVPAAVLIFTSVAALELWLRRGSPLAALLLAFSTGAAAAVKFTAIVLAPLLIVLALGWALHRRSRAAACRAGAGILIAGAGALIVVWAAYGFRWSALSGPGEGALPIERLVQRRAAVSALLRSSESASEEAIRARTEAAVPGAADRLLLRVHRSRILPEAWTYGIAFVRAFAAPRTAYLNGEYSDTGFPLYFAWTFLFKTPPGLLLALLAAAFAAARGRLTRAQLWWWGVPAGFLFLFASVSGVNIGHRHLLIIYPFLWLLAGAALADLMRSTSRRVLLVPVGIALLTFAAPLAVFSPDGPLWMPGHHLAYMNELAGGPVRGQRHLADSNIDWGQDVERVAQWWNGQRPPLAWACAGPTDPRYAGIRVFNTPFGYPLAPFADFSSIPDDALLAVSFTTRSGILDDPETRRRFQEYLTQWALVDRVGYTIEIYARRSD